MSHKKFGPDRFSRFDVYWIKMDKQTNQQIPRQAKYIYRRIINIIFFRRDFTADNLLWIPKADLSARVIFQLFYKTLEQNFLIILKILFAKFVIYLHYKSV